MGTMVGLYETALDALCSPRRGRQDGPPEDRRLDRDGAAGREPDPCAVQSPAWSTSFRRPVPIGATRSLPRHTLRHGDATHGFIWAIAAQGRSLKVVMLRTYLAMLAAAQKAYEADGGEEESGRIPPTLT